VWQCPNPECKHKVEAPIAVEVIGGLTSLGD